MRGKFLVFGRWRVKMKEQKKKKKYERVDGAYSRIYFPFFCLFLSFHTRILFSFLLFTSSPPSHPIVVVSRSGSATPPRRPTRLPASR